MKIAYLVTQYPKASHSFIRREIQHLERRGLDFMCISVRGWDVQLVDADLQDRACVAYEGVAWARSAVRPGRADRDATTRSMTRYSGAGGLA